MQQFQECEYCASKSGSPTLCRTCLVRRSYYQGSATKQDLYEEAFRLLEGAGFLLDEINAVIAQ